MKKWKESKYSVHYRQILFVCFAFVVMIAISFTATNIILRRHLVREAEELLRAAELTIASNLREAVTTLVESSFTIRYLITRGESQDTLQRYMVDMTDWLVSNEDLVYGFYGLYGYIRGDYLDGDNWQPPPGYVPYERPWFIVAKEKRGEPAETVPYVDAQTGDVIISYSQELIDATGESLGVLSIDVRLDEVGEYVESLRLSDSGYGMLINQNFEIVAHPNSRYVGKTLDSINSGSIKVHALLTEGKPVTALSITNSGNVKHIAFFRQLYNGWYIGSMTPFHVFYSNVYVMALILALVGAVLAFILSFTLYRITEAKWKADEKTLSLESALLKTMAELVERRDYTTGGHIDRTQRGIKILLEEIQRNGVYREKTKDWDIDLIIQSSQLHDIGKICIEDRILKKTGKLDNFEFGEMKKHTVFGEQIIAKIQTMTKENEFLTYAKILAASHHEKWDGTGYPKGLKENEIPLLGRIMAIADVYDALVSERPYKEAFKHEDAVNIIADSKGIHFDPFLIEVFLIVSDKFKELKYV